MELQVTLLLLFRSLIGYALQSVQSPQPRQAYRHIATPENRTFDYIIIGGGLAGLTVAGRLADNPAITVAVVEAGHFYENINGNRSRVPGYVLQAAGPGVDWNLTTTPQSQLNGRVQNYRAGKCVGGSSAINLMSYNRGPKGSYDRWASLVGDTGYQFNNFLPWMRKSIRYTSPNSAVRAKNATVPPAKRESYDRNGGPIHVTFGNWANPVSSYAEAGWRELGVPSLQDLTSGTLLGNQYCPASERGADQSRTSSAEFVNYAVNSGRRNLFIFTKSTATRIIFDKAKVARSVLARSGGQVFNLSARKEIILSAGAMHSPQILMLSGIGPSSSLQNLGIPIVKDLPGVGQNLNDHPVYQVAYEAFAVTGSTLLDPVVLAAAEKEYNTRKTGLLTHNLADHIAWNKVPTSQLSASTKADLSKLSVDWPHYMVVLSNIQWAPGGNFVQGVVMLQAVTSRGTVTLASANIDDKPVINVRTMVTTTDEELAIGSFRGVRSFFNTTSLRQITGRNVRPGIGAENDWTNEQILSWLRGNITSGLHGCCTASMGKISEPLAVTDSQARVFGVKGLRVVDASSLPFLPPGNPMSTLYGYAEKIAADIKGRS